MIGRMLLKPNGKRSRFSVATSPSNGDLVLTLTWSHSNADALNGYRVFAGATATGAMDEVADIAVTELTDPSAPSVDFLSNTDLGLNRGDSVCFRAKAYDSSNISTFSEAVCTVIN